MILVDGNSEDDTIEAARQAYPSIRVLVQSGRGKGDAFRTGFAAVTGNLVVMLDADGSADPAEIPAFIAALEAGADFAKGSRFLPGGGSADITRLRSTRQRCAQRHRQPPPRHPLHRPLLRLQRLLGALPALHRTRRARLRGRDADQLAHRRCRDEDHRGAELRARPHLRRQQSQHLPRRLPRARHDPQRGTSPAQHPPRAPRHRSRRTESRDAPPLLLEYRALLMGRPNSTIEPFPLVVLCAGVGLLICSITDALSRATQAPSPLLYWLGVLVVALPIFYRLTSEKASPGERLALVCLLGLSLYAVKVLRDAPLFTFSDELIHAFNANQIDTHHHLFRENPILEVTPYYPGLEGATSALMKLSGLSAFTAGVILVGAARLVLVASLFLLFMRISGSARTAGLGAAIYTGNFNFLYWGAQFSYESLTLPLLLLVMMALAERESAPRAALRAWAVPVVLATLAIIVTHHLTSYALAGPWSDCRSPTGTSTATGGHPTPGPSPSSQSPSPSPGSLSWPAPPSAISPPCSATPSTRSAARSAVRMHHEASSRREHDVAPTPLGARAVAILAVALLTVGLPFGLRELGATHAQAVRPALRPRRVGFFAHARPAPRPSGLGDGQPGQRVPLRRPRLRPRLCLRGGTAALARTGCGSPRHGCRARPRPRRRGDLGLALGLSDGSAASHRHRRTSGLLTTAWPRRMGRRRGARGALRR